MKKIVLLLPLLFVFSGCANPYSKFYTDLTGGTNILENPNIILPTDKPNLIQGSNVESDGRRMLENGHLLIGQSRI